MAEDVVEFRHAPPTPSDVPSHLTWAQYVSGGCDGWVTRVGSTLAGVRIGDASADFDEDGDGPFYVDLLRIRPNGRDQLSGLDWDVQCPVARSCWSTRQEAKDEAARLRAGVEVLLLEHAL